ncbi:hypothetical protein XENOCAPTIV_027786, partial [Xenoophorus captivus]
VKILQATGLPRHLSNFVFCQYHFCGLEEPVFTAPEVASSSSSSASRDPQCTVVFDSTKELAVPASEDLLEFLADGAVAIEVYGHKQANHRRNLALWDLGVIQAKTRSLRERWSEVTRRLELWVQLMELNDAGDFTAVEVLPAKDVRTGGVFQLKQGQSHRVRVEVRPVPDSGTLPLITASILSVSAGDVKVRQMRVSKNNPHLDEGEDMDSYQVKVEASWDSTVHECPQLSRAASPEQRVYLTVRTVVELSHPAHMQLVLRKRICVNVTGKQDIHGPEDREMLARLAASAEDEQSADSEAAIEKYLRSVLAVENVLTLDRLRQVRENSFGMLRFASLCLST